MELALCFETSFRLCYINAPFVESVGLKQYLKRGFGPAAVGTSSAWEASGGFCLCLPPGRGAGLSPLNTPARHCGGTSVSRRRTGAGREPPSLRLLAEAPRDADFPALFLTELRIPASRPLSRGGQLEPETLQEYKSRRPLANPKRRRHRASGSR